MKKYIETSITITPERKQRILDAAESLNATVTDVLAALMRKSRVYFDQNRAVIWKAVEYQKDSPIDKYDIWHVSLEPLCYEFGVSERLVFKVSVSLIYAVMIDLFLEDLVTNGLDSMVSDREFTTNYSKAFYNVGYNGEEFYELWTICWDRRLKKK